MTVPTREFLEGRTVIRLRPTAAEIAANDFHFFAQLAQRPHDIVAGEPAMFPIRDGFAGDEAIHVDGDVNRVVMIMVEPVHEHGFPVSDPERIEVGRVAYPS